MALHVIVEGEHRDARRWRAEVDPDTGWTRLCDGLKTIATAWFCPPSGWEQVEPATAAIRQALDRVGATLERLGFTPVTPHAACGDAGTCDEAV